MEVKHCIICKGSEGEFLKDRYNSCQTFHISCLSLRIQKQEEMKEEEEGLRCLFDFDKNYTNFGMIEKVLSNKMTFEDFFKASLDLEFEKQKAEWAAETGDLDILNRYSYSNSTMIETKHLIDKAALGGRLSTIKWLIGLRLSYTSDAIENAARNGHLETVKFFIGIKAPCSDKAIRYAAKNGHFLVVKCLLENGQPCNEYAVDAAAGSGHLDIIKYLLQRGQDCSDDALINAARGGHLDIIKYLFSKNKAGYSSDYAIKVAAEKGHLVIIKYLCSKGLKCPDESIKLAVENGHIQVVKYLVEEQKCLNKKYFKRLTSKSDDMGTIEAAKRGHIEVIKYLIETRGLTPRFPYVINAAVITGNLDLLKYLIKAYVPCCMDHAIKIAIENGHLKIVKYLLKMNKAYLPYALITATKCNQLEIVDYLNTAQIKPSDSEYKYRPYAYPKPYDYDFSDDSEPYFDHDFENESVPSSDDSDEMEL